MENQVLTPEEMANFMRLTPFTGRDYAGRTRSGGPLKPDLVAWLRGRRPLPAGETYIRRSEG